MITFTVIALGILVVASFAALIHAAGHAPEGYEDEQGFHAGISPRSTEMAGIAIPVRVDQGMEDGWVEGRLTTYRSASVPKQPLGVC